MHKVLCRFCLAVKLSGFRSLFATVGTWSWSLASCGERRASICEYVYTYVCMYVCVCAHRRRFVLRARLRKRNFPPTIYSRVAAVPLTTTHSRERLERVAHREVAQWK